MAYYQYLMCHTHITFARAFILNLTEVQWPSRLNSEDVVFKLFSMAYFLLILFPKVKWIYFYTLLVARKGFINSLVYYNLTSQTNKRFIFAIFDFIDGRRESVNDWKRSWINHSENSTSADSHKVVQLLSFPFLPKLTHWFEFLWLCSCKQWLMSWFLYYYVIIPVLLCHNSCIIPEPWEEPPLAV